MTARQLALHILRDGHYVSDRLHSQLDRHRLSDADRRLTIQLVLGVLENKLFFDYCIEALSTTKMARIDDEVLWILRLGLYQITKTDTPDFAAVDESVKLAKRLRRPELARFVNGVLRSYLRRPDIALPTDPLRRLSVQYSHPLWMVAMWADRFGVDETERLLAAGNQTPPLSLRVNAALTGRDEYLARLEEVGIAARASLLASRGVLIDSLQGRRISELPGYADGHFIVQDEASQQVVGLWEEYGVTAKPAASASSDGSGEGSHAISGEQGMPALTVIDVCSAPGGKTTHALECCRRVGAEGSRVYAFDIHPDKLLAVVEHAERLGLQDMLVARLVDGTQPQAELFESADLVLVDAPCSGLGIIRKKPEIRYNRSPEDIDALVSLQNSLLAQSKKYVKIGSNLVYSTCTISERENRGMVSQFLREHPNFRLVAEREYLPHIHGCDGFYIALLERMS